MHHVLITGARAKTGAPLVEMLGDRPDVVVRAGTRNPAELELGTADAVAFDWDDASTWAPAVDGIDGIFIVRPDREDAPQLIADLLDVTPDDTHVVLLSEIDGGYFPPDAWAMNVERAVRSSGRTWTLLRPNWFMQVFTDPRFFLPEITENGRIPFVSEGQAVAWIDTRDIAAVAEKALLDPRHREQIYELTGPEALTLDDTAAQISTALGRPVRHIELTMDEALAGTGGFQRNNDYGAFDRVRRGMTATVLDTVRDITGHAARTFATFLDDHREELRSARAQ